MQSQPSPTNPYSKPFKRLIPVAAIAAAICLSASVFTETAHAGLASFWASVVGDREASAKTSDASPGSRLDSQTMAILQASADQILPLTAKAATVVAPIAYDNTLSPDIAAAASAADAEDLNTQISTYVVRAGDTISSVAKLFSVSVNTILWANDLNSKSVLHEGDTLVILPVTGITYVIQSGDTIQGIAKKYKADVEDILNYNDLTLASTLKRGDKILIPDAEVPTPSAPAAAKRVVVGNEPLLDGWGWPSAGAGYYSCPVPGARLSQGLHGHNGVDLAIARGTPISAAAAGTVIISRSNGAWNGGYGNFVVILHSNGTQTLYAHMSKTAVAVGASVSKGTTIGYVGMTGLTTGPHVHFEVRGAQNPFSDPSLCR